MSITEDCLVNVQFGKFVFVNITLSLLASFTLLLVLSLLIGPRGSTGNVVPQSLQAVMSMRIVLWIVNQQVYISGVDLLN